jgi:hypothetical protein
MHYSGDPRQKLAEIDVSIKQSYGEPDSAPMALALVFWLSDFSLRQTVSLSSWRARQRR